MTTQNKREIDAANVIARSFSLLIFAYSFLVSMVFQKLAADLYDYKENKEPSDLASKSSW